MEDATLETGVHVNCSPLYKPEKEGLNLPLRVSYPRPLHGCSTDTEKGHRATPTPPGREGALGAHGVPCPGQ